MASKDMKRIQYTTFPDGDAWGYTIMLDGKTHLKTFYGFLVKDDADKAAYKEKQRFVDKLQKGML